MTTPNTIKALQILQSNPGCCAKKFAELMWPDSDMHQKCNGQGVRGSAAWLCAGSYLAKLAKRGLVSRRGHPTRYYITFEGRKLLPVDVD